ncbi:MAG: peptide chain release factor N(5)-glutamine methyltransferase [Paludibacter sp.]|nr:peptide chain release factor N(5)-glutamine methyltransferase [Paludibacter sp.]MDD4199689.1 peptide chain release factor N(5)-glutamine methyltransferase [Paludibacter sp.]MDD4428708.1 peptide chain release factor N(5)-glutamine methyltransferase [Paludibacter sp.]
MQHAIKLIRDELAAFYPDVELQSVSRLLISKITGYNFTEILVNKNTIFSEHQREILKNYLEKLKNGMPVQYVLGETEFCGLNFKVNESVLIPRPETEELVEWIVKEAEPGSVVLDVGTGSGCIAVALKHFLPASNVYGCDIASDSLITARENAEKNNVRVFFFQTDILMEKKSDRKYQIIVSNPPYIPLQEKEMIRPHVKNFEPGRALFVPDDDPLLFYRKIAQFALSNLIPGGKLFFEVHRDYGKACVTMLEEMSFQHVQLRKDIAGNERMIKGRSTT